MADKTTIAKAKKQIVSAIMQNGPFSHNIVSLVLMGVSRDHGVPAANALVDEFRLTKLYGIHKVKEEKNDTKKV